jgi:EAL domain-containing protein (putative c-di-GMP-specific phosphodiesterase class I)
MRGVYEMNTDPAKHHRLEWSFLVVPMRRSGFVGLGRYRRGGDERSVVDGAFDAINRVATDPLLVMRRVVDEALALIPSADGAVVELVSDDVLTYVCASGSLANSVGTQVWVGSSLSGLAVHAKAPLRCDDSEADERVDRNACRRVGAVSMICLPLPYREGVAGVLKLSSRQRFAFDDDDMRVLAGLARFIGEAIGGWGELARSAKAVLRDFPDGEPGGRPANGEPDSFGGSAAGETMPKVSAFLSNVLDPSEQEVDAGVRHRIEQTIREVGIAIVLQPIVSLKTGFVAGYEALSRFPGEPIRPPDQWFAEAESVGLGPELEMMAVHVALGRLPELPAGTYLAVNASPDAICDPRFLGLLSDADVSRIVVELTEHLQVENYDRLNAAIDQVRSAGTRLAIDDTGAGFAGFSHILRLSPDLIKLDRILTTGIDTDPVRQALAGALVNFAVATRAKVIAEGIETQEELNTVHSIGVDYGQGFLLGRPHPHPQAPVIMSARGTRPLISNP